MPPYGTQGKNLFYMKISLEKSCRECKLSSGGNFKRENEKRFLYTQHPDSTVLCGSFIFMRLYE